MPDAAIKDRRVMARLDADLHDRLVNVAQQNGLPVGLVVRLAIRNYLAETGQ